MAPAAIEAVQEQSECRDGSSAPDLTQKAHGCVEPWAL
jgi:hypothetical protein